MRFSRWEYPEKRLMGLLICSVRLEIVNLNFLASVRDLDEDLFTCLRQIGKLRHTGSNVPKCGRPYSSL